MRIVDPGQRRVLGDMVAVLEGSSALFDVGGRRQWRHELLRAVEGLELTELPTARQEFHEAVKCCAELDGGLDTLVEVTSFLNEPAGKRLRLLLKVWQACTLYQDRDWTALRVALDLHLPRISALVAEVTGDRVPLPRGTVTAWEAFVHLSMHNASPLGLPPGLVFLEHLLVHPEAAEAVGEIRAWNDHFAARWGMVEEFAALRRRLSSRAGVSWREGLGGFTSAEPPVIRSFIKVEPDLTPRDTASDQHRYLVSACVRYAESTGLHPQPSGPDTPVGRGELPVVVAGLIRRMAEEWRSRADEVVLEFFLPVELLDAPVEWWDLDPGETYRTPLLHRYPDIRIHSLERVQRRRHHHAWRRRWRRWSDEPANAALFWCAPEGRDDDEHLGEAFGEIGRQDEIMGMVLSATPCGTGDRGAREVLLGLEHGLPLVVYHRHDSGSEGVRSLVNEASADGGLAKLPERTRQWKRAASAREDPVKHLAVIFDDPEQLLDGGPNAPATFLGGTE